jgi:uncharacterized protein YodC (DUF2158 family)
MRPTTQEEINDAAPPASRNPFVRGAVVRLVSGGPKMTVNRIAGERVSTVFAMTSIPDATVECVWFEDSKCHRERFAVNCLVPA